MSHPRFAVPLLLRLLAVFGLLVSVSAEPLTEIPTKFEVWQDEMGFTWQVSKSGGIGSGTAPYFQNALGLFVNGGAFSPDGGDLESSETAQDLSLTGTTSDIDIRRNLYFDSDRGGVRVLDVLTNGAEVAKTLRLDYKTAYQYPWQDLHGTDGKIFAPGETMGDRDFGVVVKFSQSEGRHDTLFVTSSARDAMRPNVSFSSNLRELTFTYDVELQPGKSIALVHWVVQRNLQSASDAETALLPFLNRRRLTEPMISEADRALIANFNPAAFAGEGIEPFDLEALVALNRALGDTTRSSEDILWISGKNQLSGKANSAATLAVITKFGERSVSISDVAAIRGSGGVGRTPALYLRNGEVLAGSIEATDLSMKIAEGWDVKALEISDLEWLLLRLSGADGKAPDGTEAFVEFRNGEVRAVSTADAEALSLELLSPWGASTLSFPEIATLSYASEVGAPKFRLSKKDGSILTVLLAGQTLGLAGKDVDTTQIAAVWSLESAADATRQDQEMVSTEDWLEFEDVAPLSELPVQALLLQGNNLIAGTLAMETLTLVSGTVATPIQPSEIRRLRLSEETITDRFPVFEIEMRGGEILTGQLRERLIGVRSLDGREWRLPTTHLVGFLQKEEG